MRVCVALEQRFLRLPNGSVWTNKWCTASFWDRYLGVFDEVCCLARVRDVEQLEGSWGRADSEKVSFAAVPHYVGPGHFVRKAANVWRTIHRSIRPGDAFVLRVPGNISDLAWRKLAAMRHPYAVEVVGDPQDVFSPGAIRHPLRRFLRWHATRHLRLECEGASASSYVTSAALQERYPSRGPSITAATIDLKDEAFRQEPRAFSARASSVALVFVGSLEQYYKGPDVLIDAFARCRSVGINLNLTIIGAGAHQESLEARAATLGCDHQVRFLGQLPSAAVIEQLDRSDLFVLPSRCEGLPRAMLEAMARGLPCIGTTVGGIPELLEPEALVEPGSVQGLADKIIELVSHPVLTSRLAACNLDRAKTYRAGVLQERRTGFYRHLREVTEAWLRARSRRG